jgi:hypothetical protein
MHINKDLLLPELTLIYNSPETLATWDNVSVLRTCILYINNHATTSLLTGCIASPVTTVSIYLIVMSIAWTRTIL